MTELSGAVKPTSLEQDEHLTVNGVSVKRVLASGFDGTNIQDVRVDVNGKVETIADILPVLRTMVLLLANPPYVDKTANTIRNQVQSGTVTTVTTVTGLTNIDSQQGRQLVINDNVNAWANNCRARIS